MNEQSQFLSLRPGELTLGLSETPSGRYDLVAADGLVGQVEYEEAQGKVRGLEGAWSVKRSRPHRRINWRFVFRPLHDEDGPLASFYPRWLFPGGTLALSEEIWFELRPPGYTDKAWQLNDKDGEQLFELGITSTGWPARQWAVALDERALNTDEVLLVLLAACFVVVSDAAFHPGSG